MRDSERFSKLIVKARKELVQSFKDAGEEISQFSTAISALGSCGQNVQVIVFDSGFDHGEDCLCRQCERRNLEEFLDNFQDVACNLEQPLELLEFFDNAHEEFLRASLKESPSKEENQPLEPNFTGLEWRESRGVAPVP